MKTVSRSRFPHLNCVRHVAKDGSEVIYYYHKRAKRRLYAQPGTAAFAAEYDQAELGWTTPGRRARCYVYFVRAVTLGHIKIGQAAAPAGRLAQLQTGSPDRLELIGTVPDPTGGALEREIHRRFCHLRLHGEWYRAEPALMDFIAEPALSLIGKSARAAA